MHDYNTILGVIELRLSKVSYDAVQKRYRIGRSGIALIMNTAIMIQDYHWMIFGKCHPQRLLISSIQKETFDIRTFHYLILKKYMSK